MNRENAYHILVIDDDPLFGNTLCAAAKRLHVAMDYFPDLNEALHATPLSQYDLIVSDCMMPQVDGADITQYAASLLQTPVLLVSASTSHKMASNWKQYGAIGFVPKEQGVTNILNACLDNLKKGVSA